MKVMSAARPLFHRKRKSIGDLAIAKVPIASTPDAMKAARRRGLSAAMQKGSAA
jgi:hypothetical protein